MTAKVVRLDDQRRRTDRGRDEQVLIEADRIRDGLTSRDQKQANNRK
ncbi:hypothetical protein [Micromonospora carbonacea]|uniref:Uncharacterized protein n=1 Tax=Micromonospora carbonacea TaxID=47853 RepID=A0A1C5AAM7_9ACTN|nr:hypothetical protein [Micromonospora carbonacea]SCF42176.1 hypothetical protein GA0070563_11247 [Micromonospora carbonacea]